MKDREGPLLLKLEGLLKNEGDNPMKASPGLNTGLQSKI